MKSFSNKRSLFVVAVLLLVLGIFFFNKRNYVKKTEPVIELPIIKIAAAPPAVPHLISYIIQKQGFDKQNGFKIEMVGVDPTQTVSALNNGTINVAVSGVLSTVNLNYQDKNSDLRIFAPAIKLTCPFVVSSVSGILNFQQLDGKRIGIPSKSGATYPLMETLFKKTGVDVNKRYNLVEGQFFALPAMLDSGQVDAFVGICDEIDNGHYIAQGNKSRVGTLEDIAQRAYGNDASIILSGLAAKQSWLTQDGGKLANSFRQAYYESVNYIKSNPQLYSDPEIKKMYQMNDNDVIEAQKFITEYNGYSFNDWGTTISSMTQVISDAYKFGYIKGIPDSSVFFSGSN